MSRRRSWNAVETVLGLCLALTLVAASVIDNGSRCPDGDRLPAWAETDHGGERPMGSAPEDCEGDLCNTPSLAPSLLVLGPTVAQVGDTLTDACLFAGLEAPSPPTPPPEPDA